jgi:MSHA biogenesis protein MshO
MRRISDERAEAPTYFASHWLPECGFTLIEALVVIMITGIIAVAVITFVREPILAYLDTARRAELSDEADTALRRIARDVQNALPNSVRVDATGAFLEFLPVRSAGRYRAEVGTNVADDPLDFTSSTDNTFDVLGPGVSVVNGDSIVIYNLGINGSDAYAGTSRRAAIAPFGNSLNKISFNNGGQFLFASPGSRFQVISTPVTYACDLATGKLLRYAGYPITDSQPSTLAALNALVAPTVLANNLTGCSFTYNSGALVRSGVVAVRLAITRNGETVSMLHQVSVSNTP